MKTNIENGRQKEWISVADCADAFSVSKETVRRWLKSGEIVGRKIGKQWFVHPSVVEEIPRASQDEQ